MVSATTALAQSDARVQHHNIQFGKGPGIHLQCASAARERLVIKRAIYTGYMFARHIKSKKIVFHSRLERHETGGMNRPKNPPKVRKFRRESHRDLREILRTQPLI